MSVASASSCGLPSAIAVAAARHSAASGPCEAGADSAQGRPRRGARLDGDLQQVEHRRELRTGRAQPSLGQPGEPELRSDEAGRGRGHQRHEREGGREVSRRRPPRRGPARRRVQHLSPIHSRVPTRPGRAGCRQPRGCVARGGRTGQPERAGQPRPKPRQHPSARRAEPPPQRLPAMLRTPANDSRPARPPPHPRARPPLRPAPRSRTDPRQPPDGHRANRLQAARGDHERHADRRAEHAADQSR